MLERKKLLIETDCQKTRTGLLRIYQHRYSGEVSSSRIPKSLSAKSAPSRTKSKKLLGPDEVVPEEEQDSDIPADDSSGEKNGAPSPSA